MRKIPYLILLFALQIYNAQEIPKISYKDYGFEKKILKFEKINYEYADKKVEEIESEIYNFDKTGNISTIKSKTKGNEENTAADIQYLYKRGKLIKEVATFKNDNLMNFTIDYKFDDKNKLLFYTFRGNGYKENIKYFYKNDQLEKTTTDVNGNTSSDVYFYTPKNVLYKKVHQENISNATNYVATYLYYKGEEIANYTEDYTAPSIKAIEKNYTISYAIVTPNGILKLKEIEIKLSKGEISDSENLSSQILQLGSKRLDLKFESGKISLIKNNNILATADIQEPFDDLMNLTFFEITYADGTKSGGTAFNMAYYNELKTYLKELKP